jgi:hypothetical protein
MTDDERSDPWAGVGGDERPSQRSADLPGIEEIEPGDRTAYLVEPSPDS